MAQPPALDHVEDAHGGNSSTGLTYGIPIQGPLNEEAT
jgi:hypothetical protein